jgi:carbonic anhydrase/acetyltransferase-like protein (isoleucine patch superfamily)
MPCCEGARTTRSKSVTPSSWDHTHLNGTRVGDEVFVATGASLFPGSDVGDRCELRINSVVHVNSQLE